MGAAASPLARLRRAIDVGSVAEAEAAARELGLLDTRDALGLVLLLLRKGDGRYERAATRWLGRVLAEHPGIGFASARDLIQAFADLGGPSSDVARARIALALRSVGLDQEAVLFERDAGLVRRGS